jgi:hypothetical protein
MRKQESKLFKPMPLIPIERGMTEEWKLRLELYIYALNVFRQDLADRIKLQYISGEIDKTTRDQQILKIESIFMSSKAPCESAMFDVLEARTNSVRLEMLNDLSRDPNPFTNSNWEMWNSATGNEKEIRVSKGIYQMWAKDRFGFSEGHKFRIFRVRDPALRKYYIDPKNFNYLECDGAWWNCNDLNRLFATQNTRIPFDLIHLWRVLQHFFNSPVKCQLGKCKAPKVCTSNCHRIGIKLWERK